MHCYSKPVRQHRWSCDGRIPSLSFPSTKKFAIVGLYTDLLNFFEDEDVSDRQLLIQFWKNSQLSNARLADMNARHIRNREFDESFDFIFKTEIYRIFVPSFRWIKWSSLRFEIWDWWDDCLFIPTSTSVSYFIIRAVVFAFKSSISRFQSDRIEGIESGTAEPPNLTQLQNLSGEGSLQL